MKYLAQCCWCHEMMVTEENNHSGSMAAKTAIQEQPITINQQHLFKPRVHSLCPQCLSALPRINSPCCQCAMPMLTPHHESASNKQSNQSVLRCGKCQSNPPAFDYCHAAYQYQFPISNWIKRVKDKGQLAITLKLEQLLQLFLTTIELQPDSVVSVPTSRRRLFLRSCNISELLARVTAKTLSCRFIPRAIELRNKSVQRGRSGRSRRHNSQHKFSLPPGHSVFHDQHVLIIDDVMTTGATADAIARQLKQRGARIVGILVLARAI